MKKQTAQKWEEFQKNDQNPEGQAGENDTTKSYSEEEYKNLQAFSTKANQGLIDVSKKLAEKDPSQLLSMDSQIQNKVIKDIWGYDNLDELKIMLPDVLTQTRDEEKEYGTDGNEALEQMKREQELLKMKLNKKDVDDEIEKFTSTHLEVSSSIPNFDEKVREELKYISSELPVRERVNRATKLVAGNSDINVEAYLQLQWKNNIKSSWQKLNDDYILEAQNRLRAQLWLKQK